MSKTSIIDKVKPVVRSISPYTLKDYEYEVKINQNENPYDVPEDIKRDILDFAMKRSWSRYPPFFPEELRERLASYAGWKAEGIVVGNGSNELIQALLAVLVRPGGKLVIPSPTFTLYKLIGSVLGADVYEVPLNADYTFDCDAVEQAFLDNADMLILCTPNNPTGTLYPPDRIEGLLKKSDAPVIVDEAYFEFSKETVVKLLGIYDNLVVLRTFSKAFSLAGLRVGYGLMNPELAREAEKAKLPYNINFFSIAAATVLLKNREKLSGRIDELIAERDRMIPALNAIDKVTAYPSRANFILFETPFEPKKVFQELLSDGLLVRDISSYPMLGRALRVSVSTPEDNGRFIMSLRRTMEELRKES
ncbi:histidinol-phosphate transaminase [Candidatus Omnitrophota bacterium]